MSDKLKFFAKGIGPGKRQYNDIINRKHRADEMIRTMKTSAWATKIAKKG